MTLKNRWRLVALSLLIVLMGGSIPPVRASDVVWTALARGIDYAMIPAAIQPRIQGEILVVRIDPTTALFRVYYQPGQRKTVQRWAAQNPGAVVIVNANFIRGNGKALGLVKLGNDIINPPSGRPGSGQFEVRDDVPSISGLVSSEDTLPYMESFEGYPLLIADRKQVYWPVANEKRSKRSVVAQDAQGHILIIVTKPMALRLDELIGWLQQSNLNVVNALNLDGGSSSQVYVATDKISPLYKRGSVSVPVVLAVYPR